MADHGVEGVRRPVAEQAGKAGDGSPQQRGDDGVRGVLRDGLDDRAGDLAGAELAGVAADQVGEPVTRTGQVAAGQVRLHGAGFAFQGLAAQHDPGGGGGDQSLGYPGAPGRPLGRETQGSGSTDENRRVRDPASPALAVQALLKAVRDDAEARDGVIPPRVAEEAVGGIAGQQAQCSRRPRRPGRSQAG